MRRRILELLADDELTAGAVGAVVQREFGISQAAVSQPPVPSASAGTSP